MLQNYNNNNKPLMILSYVALLSNGKPNLQLVQHKLNF